MRILIVEDDELLRSLLVRGLSEDGHVIDALPDGRLCAEYLQSSVYDAMILDWNLPFEDGVTILRRLRATGVTTPTLLLTARDSVDDVIAGLDAGADDYLRKPFAFGEWEARLRTIGRRPPTYTDTTLRHGDIEFDSASRSARRNGRDLGLTAKEATFLETLMRNPGQIVTRRTLEDRLWDRESDRISNVLDVYARRVRLKLSEAGEPAALQTIRGIGFKLDVSQ